MRHYEDLTALLIPRKEPTVIFAIDKLAQSIRGGLPPSARKHSAWWANSRTAQPHAHAWLDAGRQAKPDFNAGLVRFALGPEVVRGPNSTRRR